jgi:hypothetical protein
MPLPQLPFATQFAHAPSYANGALCLDDQYYGNTPFQMAQNPTYVTTNGDGLTAADAGHLSSRPSAHQGPDDGRVQAGDALQDRPPSRAHRDEQTPRKGADTSTQQAGAPIGEGDESVGRISENLQFDAGVQQLCDVCMSQTPMQVGSCQDVQRGYMAVSLSSCRSTTEQVCRHVFQHNPEIT